MDQTEMRTTPVEESVLFLDMQHLQVRCAQVEEGLTTGQDARFSYRVERGIIDIGFQVLRIFTTYLDLKARIAPQETVYRRMSRRRCPA